MRNIDEGILQGEARGHGIISYAHQTPWCSKTWRAFFRDSLLCCVFTLARLQRNQNRHVTLKLSFPMLCLWTCLFGGIRLWCSFVRPQTNPYWSHSGEICGSKRYKKKCRESSPEWLIYSCKEVLSLWRNETCKSAGAQTASSDPNDSRSFAFWSSSIQEVFSASGSFI